MKTSLLLKIKKNVLNKSTIMLTIMLCLVFLASVAKAQPNFPFTQRKQWDGPYDIKMIAAPNLEPVYLNDSKAASGILQADSVIPSSTIRMTANLMEINNRYKGGNPFVQVDIPLPAMACKDPEAPCMQGLNATGTSSSCPTKYGTPTTVTKYVTMNYSDYDGDMSTYSSSMAKLDIAECVEIEAAYLYWAGNFKTSNPNITYATPTTKVGSYNGSDAMGTKVFDVTKTSGYDKVKFKIPGGAYQNITATTRYVTTGTDITYVCVSDVTSIVSGTGGGNFWVANIQSYPDEGNGGSTSGWTLVVVFRSPLSPPRLISLWDGFKNIEKGDNETFTLTGLQAPSTAAGFQSYIGFAALDGENLATQLSSSDVREGLGFQTNAGGALKTINPYQTDQPPYKLWTKKGFPAQCDASDNVDGCKAPLFDGNWCSVYDGVSSSHISTYDATKGTNGNELTRLPSMVNTLGYDSHHMKLPSGAVAPNATQATLTVYAGPQGSTMPFMAYVAIERLQPKLEMTKTSDVNTTGTNTQITYTLKIKNKGNDVSLGGDLIRDTLDLATTYITSSLTTIPASAANIVAGSPVTLGDGRQALTFNVSKKINAGDSISVVFKVQVKDYATNKNLWDVQCKRTITNTAWIAYNTLASGILISKSNGNDCGIGSETRVLIQDPLFGSSSTTKPLGPFNACPYITESVLTHVRQELLNAGVAASDIDLYDIRNSTYERVQPTDTFGVALSVVFYAIRDNAVGGKCQEIYQVQYKTCTLPLEILYFTGQQTPAGTRLNWAVASAHQGDTFWVERSGDGQHFIQVGKTSANTSQNYSFVDNEQEDEGHLYYKLVSIAADGSKSYSQIISIQKVEDTALSIYPNPFSGTASLVVKTDAESNYELRIVDLSGKLMHQSFGHTTNETFAIGQDLGAGMYLVEIIFDEFRLNKRFVKMH